MLLSIYVVQPGDSLYEIARRYGVPMNEIIENNLLQNPGSLVVGQTLVFPGKPSLYTVQPGDSLFTISRKFNVPVSAIIQTNGLGGEPSYLPVGLLLTIPQPPQPSIDVGAFMDVNITGEESVEEINDIGRYLTYLHIFSYHANPDGTLDPIEGDVPIIQAAYENGVVPLMVLTNISEGEFSEELATTILGNPEIQAVLLDSVIAVMDEKGYLGLTVDFEYLGAQNREPYVEFLTMAKERLSEKNYSLSAALAPKYRANQEGVLYEGHDFKAIGEVVDFINIMTYEWGWSGGPPLPVAPINEVRQVIEYAVSEVPPEKIMMGIPLYGYDWTLPYIKGGQFAKTLSPQEAIRIANENNVMIQYDPAAQSPFFKYIDEEGRRHEVWFEDARSIQAKMNLVKEFGLKGFFYWVLGVQFPQNWLVVQENFEINDRL